MQHRHTNLPQMLGHSKGERSPFIVLRRGEFYLLSSYVVTRPSLPTLVDRAMHLWEYLERVCRTSPQAAPDIAYHAVSWLKHSIHWLIAKVLLASRRTCKLVSADAIWLLEN
jgi:hypothetical protein